VGPFFNPNFKIFPPPPPPPPEILFYYSLLLICNVSAVRDYIYILSITLFWDVTLGRRSSLSRRLEGTSGNTCRTTQRHMLEERNRQLLNFKKLESHEIILHFCILQLDC
jgi:hypothetical protein